MALSNWDTLAVDHTGAPLAEASFRAADGTSVRFYKNWLYVGSEALWRPGCGFDCPTIERIDEGVRSIGALTIRAARGPRDGVYALVHERRAGGVIRAMAGCACDGYQGEAWVGIGAAEVEALARLLAAQPEPSLRRIDLSRARRTNQGDALIAGRFGVPTPDSAAGQAEEPLLSDLLRGLRAS